MRLLLSIISLFFVEAVSAQNLVYNGDFEEHTQCPTNYSQSGYCLGWRQYTGGTADYFHTCGLPLVGVPDNWFGYQNAASGNAYVGCYVFENCCDPMPYTEYVAGTLKPLSPGYTYEVSMSVSLADSSGYAANALGIWFYKNGTPNLTPTTMLTVTPQVSFAGYGTITDTLGWLRVSQMFKADSAYNNLVIGTFASGTSFLSSRVSHSPFRYYAYYYFDSITVRLAPGINNRYQDSTLLCAGDTFDVPFTLYPWSAINWGNTFSVQLSDPTGTFNSGTTIIGTLKGITAGTITCTVPANIPSGSNYQIRIISDNLYYASEPAKVRIRMRPEARASVDLPVCQGGIIHLHSTPPLPSGATCTWSGPDAYASNSSDNRIPDAKASKHNGRYTLTVNEGGCTTTTNIDLKVTDTSVDLGSDETLCMNETRLLKVNIPDATYIWQDGSTLAERNISKPGKYWVTVTTACGVSSDTIRKDYEACDCNPFIPSSFTPNGDGLNDRIGLTYIDCYITRFKLLIVNRFGEVVFQTNVPGEKWDGIYKGKTADLGTYFYLMQVTGPRDKQFRFKGDITLLR